MRALLSFVVLLTVVGCSHGPVARQATSSDAELQRLVGQSVTLHGRFELAGKVGPYIQRAGEPVYLVPHGSFSWGSDYERMQGKLVSVTGTLRFQHSERAKLSDAVAEPPDYFYLDAETAKIRLE
jgi:hypothetical protein